MLAVRKQARQPSVQSGHVPAPVGVDSVSAGSAMPPNKAFRIYNMVRAEYGLRARSGSREWVTGLTGSLDSTVRTCIPFSGAQSSGDRYFVATSTGIWDCSASTAIPSQSIAFTDTSGDAGWGISCVIATQAGHVLFYTDEVNGLYIYKESTDAWFKVAAGARQTWAANTAYSVGDRVSNGSNVYVVTVAGTSAGSGGPTGAGTGIADNTVTWNYVGAVDVTAIGPSLSDQHAGLTGDPSNFVFCVSWKNRAWFVERNTARAWYLDLLAIAGKATSIEMGTKFRAGGPLVGLWSWTLDGGSGIDDRLVAISGGGDVAIYAGSDPSSASTFELNGAWSVGAVPAGRRIANDYGGDLLILSKAGILPLSTLVMGKVMADRAQYETSDISPLFNSYMLSTSSLRGWSMAIHPEDGALIVTVPTYAGQSTNQLAMSLSSKGWSEYRGLPMYSCAVWQGKLYFGSADGRVLVNTGYVDGVTLTSPSSYVPVQWRLLTAFSNLGSPSKKMANMFRPQFISDAGSVGVVCEGRYDFDLTGYRTDDGASVSQSLGSGWDTGRWDSATWGGDSLPSQPVSGGAGIGTFVAVGVRGAAVSRTILVGIDVFYTQGGLI